MEGSLGGALGPPGVSPGLGERGDQVAPPAEPGPEPGRVPRGPPVPTRAAGGERTPLTARTLSKGTWEKGRRNRHTRNSNAPHDSRLAAKGAREEQEAAGWAPNRVLAGDRRTPMAVELALWGFSDPRRACVRAPPTGTPWARSLS